MTGRERGGCFMRGRKRRLEEVKGGGSREERGRVLRSRRERWGGFGSRGGG